MHFGRQAPLSNSSGSLHRAELIAAQFQVRSDQIARATEHFVTQLNEGLEQDGTDLLQIPSYVTQLPNGTEKGQCLAIDFGGTNLRVLSIDLHGDTTHSTKQSKIAIPPSLMSAKRYQDLFGFIASHTESFMLKNFPESVRKWRKLVCTHDAVPIELRRQHCHPLGFAFSFTFEQLSINTGSLLFWTKAFCIEDAVGRDPAGMLQEALDELQLPLLVSALVNDTVGALAARAYTSPGRSRTLLGAIFGTGTNGAYIERLSRIEKLHSTPKYAHPRQDDYMVLNTEWGGFDRDLAVLPVTPYDEALDRESVNPSDQHFEKRISGLYLGELLRRVLIAEMKIASDVWSLELPSDSKLYRPNSIDSSFLSSLVRDNSIELNLASAEIKKVLGVRSVSHEDTMAIRIIADAIGSRAARLSAIAIGGIIIQSGRLAMIGAGTSLETKNERSVTTWRTFCHISKRAIGFLVSLVSLCHASHRTPTKTAPSEEPHPDDMIDIGVDGSLFRYFPGFEQHIRHALREVPAIGVQGEKRVRMGMAQDGSGAGTALIAWAADNSTGV